MKELGITKGECSVISCDESSDTLYVHPTPTFGENENNAKLYTDAHTTANKCNLLPSELLQRYNEAIGVLGSIFKKCKDGEIELLMGDYVDAQKVIEKHEEQTISKAKP